MSDYEARRRANIQRNEALLRELQLPTGVDNRQSAKPQPKNRQKNSIGVKNGVMKAPTRSSARIASAPTRPSYNASPSPPPPHRRTQASSRSERANAPPAQGNSASIPSLALPAADLDALRTSWSSWAPAAPPPTRHADGTFHFDSHPIFTPNKSPAEILREGCFGGTYFRPLYSRRLGTTIEGDWQELPEEWVAGLDAGRMLTSSEYDPSVNKYGVACGQSIEEWEAAGWIDHNFDVRGWFQWYCRFFMGRRCDDDERQVGRWRKCVGETGRWRRILLKKYVALGIRSVFAEDVDGEEEQQAEVSPVVHQTCHHWAWEVRQEILDRFWETGT